MSPTLAKRKSEPNTITDAPEVAAAIQRQQDADIATMNRNLDAWRAAVIHAARGEPIPATVADSAVVAAQHLRLPASSMDADVAAMRTALDCDKRMAGHTAKSPERAARLRAVKQEILDTRQRLRDLEAEGHRLSVAHHEWVNAKYQRDEVEQQRPHLFRDAAELTDSQWQHIRA